MPERYRVNLTMKIVPTEQLPNVTVLGSHGSSDLIFEALAKAIRRNSPGEASDASVTVRATPPTILGEVINFEITVIGKRWTDGPINADAWRGGPTYSPTAGSERPPLGPVWNSMPSPSGEQPKPVSFKSPAGSDDTP
jgi:hypothetical protein